jgi:hypothetical protein
MHAPPLHHLADAAGDHCSQGSIAAPSGTRHAGELPAGRPCGSPPAGLRASTGAGGSPKVTKSHELLTRFGKKATTTLEGKVWSGKQVAAIYKYMSIYAEMAYSGHDSHEPLWAGLSAQKEVYHVLHPARTYHQRHRVFCSDCSRRYAPLWDRRTFCAVRIHEQQRALMSYVVPLWYPRDCLHRFLNSGRSLSHKTKVW